MVWKQGTTKVGGGGDNDNCLADGQSLVVRVGSGTVHLGDDNLIECNSWHFSHVDWFVVLRAEIIDDVINMQVLHFLAWYSSDNDATNVWDCITIRPSYRDVNITQLGNWFAKWSILCNWTDSQSHQHTWKCIHCRMRHRQRYAITLVFVSKLVEKWESTFFSGNFWVLSTNVALGAHFDLWPIIQTSFVAARSPNCRLVTVYLRFLPYPHLDHTPSLHFI